WRHPAPQSGLATQVRPVVPPGRQPGLRGCAGDHHADQPQHGQNARGRIRGTRLLDFRPMSGRSRSFAALVVMSMLAIGVVAQPAHAAVPTPPTTVESLAWCGVSPDDPVAADAVRAMAMAGGIDATFGPCDIPDPNFKPPYSPAFTADRYVAPDVYMRLVQLNATVGMKTVVYDARLWADDFAIRDSAIAYWKP